MLGMRACINFTTKCLSQFWLGTIKAKPITRCLVHVQHSNLKCINHTCSIFIHRRSHPCIDNILDTGISKSLPVPFGIRDETMNECMATSGLTVANIVSPSIEQLRNQQRQPYNSPSRSSLPISVTTGSRAEPRRDDPNGFEKQYRDRKSVV